MTRDHFQSGDGKAPSASFINADRFCIDDCSVMAGPHAPSESAWRVLHFAGLNADCAALLAFFENASAQRDYAMALLALLLLTRATYQAGQNDDARRYGAQAVELARQTGDVLAEAQAYRWLALAAFDQGRSKDGHDHLLDAMAAYDLAHEPREVPVLMRWYAEHLATLGARAEAEQAMRLAREKFLAMGDEAGAQGCAADLLAIRNGSN